MHLTYRNADAAFRGLVSGIHTGEIPTVRQPSRVGDVLRIPEPVTITYERPTERVLFNKARDCNPFFHLYESLWMLAGRNDVKSLVKYNPRMKEFSDDGETLHGAYGYRWREWFGYDQLDMIVKELRDNPGSRRCVLQMWDASANTDDEKGRHDLWTATHGGLDVPCNSNAYFQVLDGKLDMTVCNRSNDLVWGMLGANVVHFSILQEYLAARIGVEVGKYHQFTNNLHVYTERWEPEKWLADVTSSYEDLHSEGLEHFPLVQDPKVFEEELQRFVDDPFALWQEPFFKQVEMPMLSAFERHKNHSYHAALETIKQVGAHDWRTVGTNWLLKRKEAWEVKHQKESV